MGFFGPPPPFTGASTTDAGASGLVPAPSAGKNTRGLFSNSSFSEVPLYPQYKNTANNLIGTYVFAGGTTGVPTPISLNARVRNFGLIYSPSDGNIDTLLFRVNTGPAVAVNVHVAIWEVAENGEPSSYVIGGTASSGTTSSVDVSFSITSTPIKRGFYYISQTPDANTSSVLTSLNGINTNIYLRNFIGSSSLGNTQPLNFGYTATTYNQTTHETFSLSATSQANCGFYYE